MAKFSWHPNGTTPRAFVLKAARISIGRDPTCDMVVDEPSVSTRHAMALVAGSTVTLHDLESRNGTWVNGQRIQLQQLKHADVVQFGRLKVTFIDESQAAASAMARRGQTLTATEKRAEQIQREKAPSAPLEQPAPAIDFSELDKVLGAVRDQRRIDAAQEDLKTRALRQEWQHALNYAEALKQKLSDEPRMRFFDISPRRSEIVMRVERRVGDPLHLMQITLGHADRPSPSPDGIWLRQTGCNDQRFDGHATLMREVVSTLASILA